jgi:hypothetical protein
VTRPFAQTGAVGTAGVQWSPPAPAQGQHWLLKDARITGRARLADGQEVEVTAVPAAP